MKKYLVIGNPIEHSLSPKLHNYWFEKNNIDANYDRRKIDKSEINNYDDAIQCDVKKYAIYFKYMLDMGIYLPPSQYECCFFSLALSDSDI